MLRGLLDAARTKGFDALTLRVGRVNPAVVKLYERNGFAGLRAIKSECTSWITKVDFATRNEVKGPRRAQPPATVEPRD